MCSDFIHIAERTLGELRGLLDQRYTTFRGLRRVLTTARFLRSDVREQTWIDITGPITE